MSILEKSQLEERLDFTNGLLNFVNKIDKRHIDGLLPALKLLVSHLTNCARLSFFVGQ